ncbi:uncharacterized protein OCT59_020931 [Rhizophagus irregularis]|uniref:uncharacterized protein n=1 Tax=Rhizophagus irregularis TaxID=588596 RepID=UPI00331CF8CF|nr:hypothetical protein OCT59_020931 [Rhizophagus irregularis]
MEQSINYKHKIDFLVSDNIDHKKCNECKIRKTIDESNQLCYACRSGKYTLSGNNVIDDFIIYTQSNNNELGGELEFVYYNKLKNIEFIAEGGFSKIYKATWINGPIYDWFKFKNNHLDNGRKNNYTVVLKKLNDSKNITSKELNELKVFYQIYSDSNVSKLNISQYLGITRDPITRDYMIIMPYYKSGDMTHFISNDFYNISWENRLNKLRNPTKIIKSSDIGPVAKNNPGAIYKSRPLSRMIHSAMSLKSSRSRSINTNLETDPFYYYQENNIASTDKRKFENDSVEDSNDDSQSIIKKGKLFKTKNSDYITKEIEIDININLDQPRNNEYITKEFDIDINNL